MISLKIHDHALKHGIAKEDIVHAWTNSISTFYPGIFH